MVQRADNYVELVASDLRRSCDCSNLPFNTTEELPDLEGLIGQERPARAIDLGLVIDNKGYNIFVTGETGTGRTTYTKATVEKLAAEKPAAADWCYVHNFEAPEFPLALRLPAGRGTQFKKDMQLLIDSLQEAIRGKFDSQEYERQKQTIINDFQRKSKHLFEELEAVARQHGFQLKRTSTGIITIPIVDGSPIEQEEYSSLDEETKKTIEEKSAGIRTTMQETTRKIRSIEKEAEKAVRELDKQVALYVVQPLVQDLMARYDGFPEVTRFLRAVQEDILDNLDRFKDNDEDEDTPFPWMKQFMKESFTRYRVNVLVDNGDRQGAPVEIETNPTYHNLFGKVEYKHQFGAMVTDFTMIRSGSLHRANGGYLIVHARDLLTTPLAWEALKRALKSQEIKIEDIGERYGITPASTLKPQPVPLNVKLVVIGDPFVYYLLQEFDPDFGKLFKIRAEFDTETDRTDGSIMRYAQLIASICRRENLLHFRNQAVARVIEEGSRLAEDQTKLSICFNKMLDLIYEANAWAIQSGSDYVEAGHVNMAVEQKIYRSRGIQDRIQEMILRGKILVDTEGEYIGQVNGIAVYDAGDYRFGKPVRITARTFLGKEGVVNIEREVELSGRIHDKGMLILTGYLGAVYAQDRPLSLSASICFEQSYDGIEGDSASSAELYALLSCLAQAPIRQDIAVTGSVNQKGEIQPVGGVNEKIEGFFDVCAARGLTGRQGVIIPEGNKDNLMLRQEVVDAVAEGRFHVYAVRTINQGMEILTGLTAGERDDSGNYPEGTLNHRITCTLDRMAEKLTEFTRDEMEEGSNAS